MKKVGTTLFLVSIALLMTGFMSCQNQLGGDNYGSKNPINNDLGSTFSIDMKERIFIWNDAITNFEKNSGKLTISKNWDGVGFWLSDDDRKKASKMNYLELKYKNPTSFFWVSILYKDETSSRALCHIEDTVAYVELESTKKDKIDSISIQSFSNNLSVVLESAKFTEKRPEEIVVSAVVDKKASGSFDSEVSAIDFAKRMKLGWNLGDSLDASPDPKYFSKEECAIQAPATEVLWDEVYTTKEIIHFPKTQGYSTIRIPVTWFCHIIDDNYTIDPKWMTRVKQVVDWAIADGYYVILNEHHSVRDGMHSPIEYGEGYIPRNTPADIEESERFLKAVWKQIATAFNNSYDEHLIFETMNEPRNTMHEHDQWQAGLERDGQNTLNCPECLADYEIVNKYNQICVDTIRASGGNNAKRFILIPSLVTSDESPMHELFKMPADSASDKLMLAVHNYIWLWTRGEYPTFTDAMKTRITNIYSELNTKFISKGVPVVIDETGADKKIYNKKTGALESTIVLEERIKWMTFYANLVSGYGIPMVEWDGGDENGVCQYDRVNLKFYNPELIQAMFDNWQCN